MNRTYSLIILAACTLGAFFSISIYSASDVYASGDKSTKDNYDEYCPCRGYDDREYDNEEYDNEEYDNGYYDQYESGYFEDRYGKPYYK
jgi:hypothetical protein